MTIKRSTILYFCLGFLISASIGHAAVLEWDVKNTLKLKEAPLDMAVSKSGKWIFILTEAGEVNIYSGNGTLEGTVSVGTDVNGIKEGPEDNLLLVSDRKNKSVQVVNLDFIQKIDVSGSAVRGKPDAPITITLFAEFQ